MGASRGGARIAVAALVAAAFLLAMLPLAEADPIQEKKQRLEEIKRQVQEIDSRLETVVEQYNTTVWRLQQTKEEIRRNEKAIEAMNARIQERQSILGSRLRSVYMMGQSSALEVLLDCKSLDDFLSSVPLALRIGQQDAEMIRDIQSDRAELDAANRRLQERKQELQSAAEQAARQKASIEAELARRRELMAGVEAEVNALIRQEEERRAAAAAAAARPAVAPITRNIPTPPPNPNAPAVVKVAYAQLGKPYQYAAAGPDRFDCSGLVMYCYAQVGVRLPHSSYAQFQCGYPVSYDDLQPGDLVFFHGAGHVGMYIGNGQYIHAPRTGDVVRIADLSRRRDFCGARRII